MTDSLKVCVDLRDMPEEARREVEVHHAQTKNKRHQNIGEPYPKPISATSPISGTGMELVTYWEGSRRKFLQSHIVADLNIPNATTGHNCEHGTSVFAAGVAGLYLLKHRMACDGVPGDALDLLTTHHVTLLGATVTFLLPCETEEQTHSAVLQLKEALRILGHSPCGSESSNVTVYLRCNGYSLKVYQKTNFSHCVFPDEEMAETLKARARSMIRIEVYMQGHLLRGRGWHALESWRNAYAEGRYERIFREMVRSLFKLEVVRKGEITPGTILRHKAPRQEAMEQLTNTERKILSAYLAGTPVDELPCINKAANSTACSKITAKWRKPILRKVRIDITIPWAKHQELRHMDLERLLQYPGDYHPDAAKAGNCFCAETWGTRLKKLKSCYRRAVKWQPCSKLGYCSPPDADR